MLRCFECFRLVWASWRRERCWIPPTTCNSDRLHNHHHHHDSTRWREWQRALTAIMAGPRRRPLKYSSAQFHLIGTQIPFTDPFAFGHNDFRASCYTSGSDSDLDFTAYVYPVSGWAMVRLTPEQAIAIFRTRRTKTARTASRLVTKYGITPKAIRDIDAQDLGRRHPASLERVETK